MYSRLTYRERVCAIVLPHLQQGHNHFMEFISRQNPITVHIKHFKANCQIKDKIHVRKDKYASNSTSDLKGRTALEKSHIDEVSGNDFSVMI